MREWSSAAIIVAIAAAAISLIGAGASLWAAWVSHRVLKRQKEGDKPAVTCQIEDASDGWLSLRIIIENPTTSSWIASSLRVISPAGAIAGGEAETHSQDSYGATYST